MNNNVLLFITKICDEAIKKSIECKDLNSLQIVLSSTLGLIIVTCNGVLINKSNKDLNVQDLIEDKIKDIQEIGPWLSAALEDQGACEEFKNSIKKWFDRTSKIENLTGETIEKILERGKNEFTRFS